MAGWDADEALTRLYAEHWVGLVRLGTLLLRDSGQAEEVVQDSFVAMHGAWRRLRDPDRALAYLRQTIVNRSRTALRRRRTVEKHAPDDLHDVPSAEHSALRTLEHDRIMAALHGLARRQREVLVLRYYADLSEADIAATLGISRGAVKSHSSRGVAALRTTWEADA